MNKFQISPYSSLTLEFLESAQTLEIIAEDNTLNDLGLGYGRTSTELTSLANAHYSDGATIQARLYNIFSILAKGETIETSDTIVELVRNTTVQFDTAVRGHRVRLASNSQGDINLNIKGQDRESVTLMLPATLPSNSEARTIFSALHRFLSGVNNG